MPAEVIIEVKYRDQTASAARQTATGLYAIGESASASSKQMAALAAKADDLAQHIGFQNRELQIAQKELSEVTAKYTEGSTQAQRKQLAVDKLTAAIKDDEQALEQLRKEQDQAGQSSSKFGEITIGALRKVGEMAVSALAEAGQAFIAFVGDSINAAGDYEQSMNVFQATTGATADQMAAASDLAKQLGGDLSLPATSAASAGEAMTALAQAGLSVDDAMAAAKGTLQLAAAGMIDEKEAAEITAAALNQFHDQHVSAIQVADLLAASISASGSSVAQTGQAVQQAGAAFAAAHVPIEDFVTLVNEMAKSGIKGSDAGTSLKTMLMRLQAPTSAAASEMQNLGINVYDAQGAMLPMRTIIGQFSSALSGLTQQQRDQAVVTIFGSDAQRAANIVLAGGTDAYDTMHDAVTRAGAAQDMAAAQMKGLKGAMAGLSSQVETLMLEGLEPLLPIMASVIGRGAEFAGSLVGQVGPAVQGVIGFLGSAADIVGTALVPALSGLTAAGAAYAVVQAVELTPAVLASIPVFAAQAAAVAASAAAVGLALLPYVAIAAAVGVVVLKFNEFQQKLDDATASLLDSKQFWTDSTTALQNYGNASEETRAKTASLAGTIEVLRGQIEQEIRALGERMANGAVTKQQYEAEMAVINQKAASLQVATGALNAEIQATIQQQAATLTATQYAADLANATQQIGVQAQLTAEDLEKFQKQIDETFQKGAQAVQNYVTTEVGFLGDLAARRTEHEEKLRALYEEKQKAQTATQREELDKRIAAEETAYADQQQAAAVAYAQEQAAQKAHLGAMLTDYTLTQVQMHNITVEQGQQIIQAVEQQFGVQKDASAATFLAMAKDIDQFAASGSSDINALAGDLGTLADDAVTTRQRMDELAKQYTANLIHNFQEGKISAQELADELKNIPAKVYSEVVVNHIDTYESRGDNVSADEGASGYRAGGGSVSGGEPYIVGEVGQELFVPQSSGTIIPNDRLTIGGTTNNYYQILNYSGAAASEGSVDDALRVRHLLYG